MENVLLNSKLFRSYNIRYVTMIILFFVHVFLTSRLLLVPLVCLGGGCVCDVFFTTLNMCVSKFMLHLNQTLQTLSFSLRYATPVPPFFFLNRSLVHYNPLKTQKYDEMQCFLCVLFGVALQYSIWSSFTLKQQNSPRGLLCCRSLERDDSIETHTQELPCALIATRLSNSGHHALRNWHCH